MKRLLVPILAFAMVHSGAKAQSPLRDQLVSALMGHHALETMRHLAELKTSHLRAEGIRIEHKDDGGYDEVIRVHLSKPLALAGARTSLVTMAFDSPYRDFNGLVFAEFEGDLRSFARAQNLAKGKPKNTSSVGTYNRPLSEEHGCPVTLGATATRAHHFAFGCGWCNG